ncbi:MAG: HMA2 domain-containing protein [Dissulfurispiraceae bacterium]
MIPEAIVCHSSPGRSRVKVPSRKGDAAYFSSLKDHFAHLEGVKEVEANAVTGSVVFMHAADLKAISTFAEDHSLFRLIKLESATPALSRNVVKSFRDFDKKVKKFTGNELDVPGVAFLTLLGLGIYEIGRGNFAAPAWYTAFWYSLNIFLKSVPHTTDEENK